ncbi:MAG: sodium:solute symporter family protein [Methanotrichaceae archaeon]|nr:sodium:solute symporter family protein [Methanotrichaceae archaeon]
MLVIGAWGPRIKNLKDFHLAGRGIALVLLTGTFCATIIGASATLGMAGLGFSKGLPGAWWMLAGTAGLLVLASFFAEKVRATGCYTLPELVGSFYGERVRVGASVLIAVSWAAVIAVQIVASGKVLGAVFGGSETLFMVATTAVFVLYTVHGGQASVVRTDLVQFLIIITGIMYLFYRAIEVSGSGPLLSQSFPLSAEMGSWDVISMLLVVGSAYLVGPDMYSRLFSANSSRDAKISAAVSAIILIPLAFVITSLGILSKSIYPTASPEQAIPALMTGLLSPTAEGLVAAALLAAFMSSADTSLMTATSIMTLDLYGKVRPHSSEKKLMAVSRLFVLIIGTLALALAISLPSIIKTLLIAYTIFTSGLLLPVVAGFYKDRLGLTSSGAFVALVGGGITAVFMGQKYPLLGIAVSAALLFGISWLERRYAKQKWRNVAQL